MRMPIIVGVVALIVITLLSSIFIVDEKQQAIVLQFGEVKRTICGSSTTSLADAVISRPSRGGTEDTDVVEEEAAAEEPEPLPVYCDTAGPGLYFKMPWIQDVDYYEDRILPIETAEIEVTPADSRRLAVQAFARWRIQDPKLFRQTERTVIGAERSLSGFIDSSLRQVLGEYTSAVVLSPERAGLMRQIRDLTRDKAIDRGIDVVDIRISRADFPEENRPATFSRMNAEREREARDERARGDEQARRLTAEAERQAVELVSEAQREAEKERGKADANRVAIFADAFGRDEEFFAFYRSLRAYRESLKGSNSTLVISPDSEFFDYLKSDSVRPPQ
ncbi:MAG: protease modulator HflC [Pseudomonadota bacterium]